jgi:hypothetical protein
MAKNKIRPTRIRCGTQPQHYRTDHGSASHRMQRKNAKRTERLSYI